MPKVGKLVAMVEPINSNAPQPADAAQLQFGLPMLFYITTVYAVGMFIEPEIFVFTTMVLLYWLVLSKTRGCGTVFVMLVGLVLLVSMSLPTMSTPREYSRRHVCRANIRDLTLALLDYESSHRHFPAAHPVKSAGKPKYSWRVLVLPFVGEQALYDQYDFDEPWDGPENIKLLAKMPNCFGCPSHRQHNDHTPYKLVVDQGTAFEEGRTISYVNIEDGSTNTICIVEDTSNPVPWTKPEDLTVEQAIAVLSPRDPRSVAHVYPSTFWTCYIGSNVSWMYGATDIIGPTIDPEVVRSLCLIADGEIIDHEKFGDSVDVNHREKHIALGIYLCLLLLPCVLLVRKKWNKRSRRSMPQS